MVLNYRFKKEKLEDGSYANRPKIFVELSGSKGSIMIPALVDTGCDTTAIPEGMAKAIGLNLSGAKSKIEAFRESSEVILSSASIKFLGKHDRQNVTLSRVPVGIVLKDPDHEEEEDITLGLDGIFDKFDITFKKSLNKIIFKPISR